MAILDFFRSPSAVAVATPVEKPDVTLATRGPRVTFGEIATEATAENMMSFLSALPDPDPVLRKAGLDLEAYRELMVDEHLRGVVDTRKDQVRELEWQITPGTDPMHAEVIERMLRGLEVSDSDGDSASLGIYQVITEILDAPLFGRQPLELMWEERNVDGRDYIWLTNIVGKPAEWFRIGTDRRWRYYDRTRSFDGLGLLMPPRKLIMATHGATYKNPHGVAILGSCYWPVTFSKANVKFWVTFIEKYGMPWVHAQHEDDSGSEKANDLLAMIQNMRQDGAFVTPLGSEVQIVPNGQKSSADIFESFVAFCEARISKAILGHGAAADSTPGKLGNEEGAMSAKWGRAASDRRLVEAVMNKAIRWIWELNWATGEPPTFTFYEEEDVDQATAARDQALYSIGWRPTLEYVQKTYGFEEADFSMLGGSTIAFDTVGGIQAIAKLAMDYEARLISRQAALTVAVNVYKVPEDVAQSMFAEVLPPAPVAPPPGAAFAEASAEGDTPPASPDPSQTVIDTQVAKAAGDTKPMDALTAEVVRLIDEANDWAGAIAAVEKAFPNMNSDELEEEVVRRLFGAETTGRLSVEGGDDDA